MKRRNCIHSACINEEQLGIMNLFRMLWEQHVNWTRAFIVSALAGLEDLDVVTGRLLRNPADFTNILKQYYGYEKAAEFERLLRAHLLLAADLLNAAKAGEEEAAQLARRKWYHNASEIAHFLSDINPYWNEDQWKTQLFDHLSMVEEIVTLRMAGKFEEETVVSDMNEQRALSMADYMAAGIIKQFTL
ncbi:MAG: hypothetical protein ACOX4J_05915 [Anaerovoracaceae bacterium]|jgi:hypothetical protein